jgi:EAL domain-containing protein (putative c-di-GMP-specific phosphodiesterase class I)/DNA-binding response OmpR family regulator/GGDEF domain-containing protein
MSKTILLVDDEVGILRALTRVLQRGGYRVLTAENGAAGLQALVGQQVALVISDFRMPGMKGSEFLQQVKAIYPNTIGMILSGYADRDALLECMNSGAAWRFLEKPWNDEQLLQEIDLALAERDRRYVESQRTNLLMSSDEALLELSANGQVLRFNSAATHVLGLQPSELKGKVLADLFDDINPIELATFFHKKDHDMVLHCHRDHYVSLSHRISDLYHYLLRLTPIQELRNQVFDGMAGLLDLPTLRSRIENMLLSQQPQFAVVELSVMDYQRFSDTLLEPLLDELLLRCAGLLQQNLPFKALLAYISADRFAVVFPEHKSETVLQEQINQLLSPFNAQMQIGVDRLQINFCVGYALSPEDGDTAKQLLQHAGVACRQNEANPKAFYLRFDREMVELKRQHFEISNSLVAAMEEQQFQLYFQPKIDLKTGRCDEAEALIRWHHPTMGWVSPALFIPIAERDGQIMAIGQWVLERCIQQLATWRQQGVFLKRLAINLSGRQLQDSRLPQILSGLLSHYQLDAHSVELEITETFLMADIQSSAELLASLKAQGCQLAMDDFGTGYSSLAYLAKLPVDVLKLDRSLLLDLEDSPQCASMVRHMIRMAHELGLQVVAEGIESDGQVRMLREMSCDLVQGFVFSTALDLASFTLYLQQQPAVAQLEQFADA